MYQKLKTLWKQNKSFLLFIVLMIFFRNVLADWNGVNGQSMQPTLLHGDRVWVNRVAYDVRIPFTNITVKHISDPKRGDIVIVKSKVADKRLIKRIIGIPGNIVAMENNVLSINGKRAEYTLVNAYSDSLDLLEEFAEDRHMIRYSHGYVVTDFDPVVVPENSYLVLGDNRQNSADFRTYGFIHRDEIIGRSSTVVLSLDSENYFFPRLNRFMKDIL